MPLLARRNPQSLVRARPQAMTRSLTASARVVPMNDRNASKSLSKIRPGWQSEAWAYRRNLGELRYACAYLGNSSMRIRLFPASYAPGSEVPDEMDLNPALPADLKAAARDVMLRLSGGGPLALSMMQKKITENFEITGEGFLVGEYDQATGMEDWSFRSTSELTVAASGEVKILEFPGATNADARTLAPDTFVSRLWWPDPEWGMLADSPIRSVLDLCEELLLLGKDVRATARSRLALNGILGIPDSLSIIGQSPEASSDPTQDPFWQTLMETVTAALTNEGSAASVVPILLRGPADALNAIKHIKVERDMHDKNIEQRQELISRIATGLDLPAEVLTGKVDLNHWTAWQVDDDAFRHHIEPMQVVQNDALTAGYLWPMLDAYGMWDPRLVRQVVIWHDPTELLTHPDRSADAFQAWDRFAISDDALRNYLGFPEGDAPDSNELLVRIVTKARTLDPALVETILKRLDPSLPAPTADAVPGAPGGALPAGPTAPAPATPPTQGPPDPAGPQQQASAATQYAVEAMAHAVVDFVSKRSEPERIVVRAEPALTAAAGRASHRDRTASRRLVDIDRELRAKVHTAANAAVKRALERAGAKIVSKSRGKGAEAVRASISGVPQHRIAATVGPAVIAALGLDAKALSDAEFAELEQQWQAWVSTGQEQALRQAARIAGVDVNSMYGAVTGTFKDNADAGWAWLQSRLQRAVVSQMSAAPVGEEVAIGADDTFVSMGLVRGALSIAGGFLDKTGTAGISDSGQPVDPSEGMGGIGTGETVSQALQDAGAATDGYTWVHGPSSNPFEPHLNLDGVDFSSFDDDALTNDENFPDYAFFAPGDHDGCSCDYMVVWTSGDSTDNTDNSEEG